MPGIMDSKLAANVSFVAKVCDAKLLNLDKHIRSGEIIIIIVMLCWLFFCISNTVPQGIKSIRLTVRELHIQFLLILFLKQHLLLLSILT